MAGVITGRPLLPSGTKLDRERRVSTADDMPVQANAGWDVSDWQSVLLTVHPIVPTLSSGSLPITSQVYVRIWRFRHRAAYGEGRPDGQWFTDENVIMSIGGDPQYGPMEWILPTKNAERMYIQYTGNNIVPPPGTFALAIGLYGIGEPRTTTSEGTPYSAGNNPDSPDSATDLDAAASAFFPLQDAMISNLAGDFTVTYVNNTTILCTGTFEESLLTWMESNRVVMVGRKPDSTTNETEFTLLVRGGTLDCRVNVVDASNVQIILETNFFTATDEFIVYFEGPRHRYEVTGIDGTRRQQVRSEAFTVATQSERVEEIDPLDQRYVPDILADGDTVAQATTVDFYLDMAGYRYFTIQWIPSDANYTLLCEATDEDNGTAPASCDYYDITLAWFGAATFTAACFILHDLPTFIKYLHIEITRAGAVGNGTHKLYTRRGW